MIPLLLPTGYVLLFSHAAETVRLVGDAMTEVKFHPKVRMLLEAILK